MKKKYFRLDRHTYVQLDNCIILFLIQLGYTYTFFLGILSIYNSVYIFLKYIFTQLVEI